MRALLSVFSGKQNVSNGLRGFVRLCVDLARLGPIRRYRRRRRVVVLTTGPGAGLRFCQDRSDENHGLGANELPVQEALARVLQAGGVFYDVGANVGYLTIVGAKLAGPKGAVWAFEPVTQNVVALRRNVRLNGFGNVTVVERAVSSAPGRQTLVLARDAGGAALEIAERPPDEVGSVQVDVTTLDVFIGEPGVRPPTVVKIDVEGAEIHVLKGMVVTLERFKPAVLLEVDGSSDAHVEAKTKICREFLESRGYQIERLADSYANNAWRVRHFLAVSSIRELHERACSD